MSHLERGSICDRVLGVTAQSSTRRAEGAARGRRDGSCVWSFPERFVAGASREAGWPGQEGSR